MISVLKFFKIYFSLLVSAIQVLIALLVTVVILGAVMSIVEKIDFWNAQYLSFVTALTIGYGDLTPHTPFGKVISIMLAIIGMVFMGIMIAAAIKSLEKVSLERR